MSNKTVATQAPDVNTIVSFDDAIAAAVNAGLSQADVTYIANPYEVLNGKDKDKLLDVPFYIRYVRIATDEESGRDYAVIYTVTKDDRLFIITDGSTGIFRQLTAAIEQRRVDKHPTPDQNFLVANGLRKSEYFHEESQSKATTYYLA